MSGSLDGHRVWLTRPANQNENWATALAEAGAEVDIEPLLSIEEPDEPRQVNEALVRAENTDILIACSANAVRWTRRLRPEFAPVGELFAIGQATATVLEDIAGQPVMYPHGTDSEALLALSAMTNVAGRNIALLAGQGGRTLLRDTLFHRGALVEKVTTYRRARRTLSNTRLKSLVDWADTIVITSGDALDHLCALLVDARVDPAGLPELVVPSQRTSARLDSRLYKPSDCRILPAMRPESLVFTLAKTNTGYRQ